MANSEKKIFWKHSMKLARMIMTKKKIVSKDDFISMKKNGDKIQKEYYNICKTISTMIVDPKKRTLKYGNVVLKL